MSQQSVDPRATAFQSIPVIDIQPLREGSLEDQLAVARQIGQAARDVGFFQVTGHGIPEQRREQLLAQAQRYFAQSEDQKMADYIGLSSDHRGYVPPGEESPDPTKRDVKEAFDLAMDLPASDPAVGPDAPMLGPNQWPPLEGFKEDVQAYYDATYQVGRELMRGFALALDLPEDRFLRYVNKPPSQLRLIHYPYDPQAVDAEGVGAHTDYECFTLLLPTTSGLEVMNGQGQWIDVPYIEGALVVNIGDMLEIWTNGEFIATSHRVRKIKEERYSFPLFFACDYHTVVEPLPELVARHGETQYSPLRSGDHLYAQTIQTFYYLQQRLERGEIALPAGSLEVGSLGQHGRQKTAP